jgi:hypothetical protein
LALVLPLTTVWPTAQAALPKGRRGLRLALGILVVLATLTAQGLLAVTQPSIEHASTLEASGDLDSALLEYRAAAELGIDADEGKRRHDRTQLRMLEQDGDAAQVWSRLSALMLYAPESKSQADRIAVARFSSYVANVQARGELRPSLALLSSVPQHLQLAEPLVDRRTFAYAEIAIQSWNTITSKTALAARLAACSELTDALKALEREPSSRFKVSAVETSRACQRVQAEEAARIRLETAAAATARRKAEQDLRSAQLRADREAAAWANAPLLCRDGTLSPSCKCGGSRRGCCSHHGGVSGCSK